jgi:hypothetical protein
VPATTSRKVLLETRTVVGYDGSGAAHSTATIALE